MKVVAIVQARIGSTRFPGKVMQLICNTPMIGLLLGRLARSKSIDKIILATGDRSENGPLETYINNLGYYCFRGSEDDVLNRYHRAAKHFSADVIVRITGDCPLTDSDLVDRVVEKFIESGVDYASNTMPPTYPDGLDVEVFSFAALDLANKQADQPRQREHVTPFMRESDNVSRVNLANAEDLSSERWTVDEPEDLDVIQNIFRAFSGRLDFSWQEVFELYKNEPDLFTGNRKYPRDEGNRMVKGQKLWRRAKRIIPGGSMLFSKRPEMFLPEYWPTYFSRAKGCKVWDLEGIEYTDMSLMGVGTNILGYGNPEVDAEVQKVISLGNMSTLNCPEEVYLAERLVDLHPWSDMVRFARTGSEAVSIAIRIARAASGKDKVAMCGYHGWQDWYLAANLIDLNNLSGTSSSRP